MSEQVSQPQAVSVVPPQILEKLKQHEEHQPDVTCLECGYQGMMGIKSRGIRPFLSMFLAILFACGFAFFGVWGIWLTPALLGGAWVVFMGQTAKPIVTCPNCNKDLGV